MNIFIQLQLIQVSRSLSFWVHSQQVIDPVCCCGRLDFHLNVESNDRTLPHDWVSKVCYYRGPVQCWLGSGHQFCQAHMVETYRWLLQKQLFLERFRQVNSTECPIFCRFYGRSSASGNSTIPIAHHFSPRTLNDLLLAVSLSFKIMLFANNYYIKIYTTNQQINNWPF